MDEPQYVYAVITSSYQEGPLWGVFADAWSAIDALRRDYPGAERMMIRDVGVDEHVIGTVYAGLIRGGAPPGEVVVKVQRVPVQTRTPVNG